MKQHKKGGTSPWIQAPKPTYVAPYKGHATTRPVKSPWPSKRSGGALSANEPGMRNSSGVLIKKREDYYKMKADRAKADADAYNQMTPAQHEAERARQVANQTQMPAGKPYVSKYIQDLNERNAKREAYENSWQGKANKAFFTPVTRALADAGNFLADYGDKVQVLKPLAYAAKLSRFARGEGKPRKSTKRRDAYRVRVNFM